MSRLTKKNNIGYFPAYERETKENYYDLVHMLGVLEDLQEELRFDLSVLFSALKIGVYYFDYENQLIHDYVWLINNYITAGASEKLSCSFETFYDRQILSFEDYGKTWSLEKKDLTKKELENEEKI